MRCCTPLCAAQVTAQRDGARLLVTLESKQAERLDAAVQRFQTLLQPGAVLGVQQDVSSLSGQSGKHSGTLPLSPVVQQQSGSRVGSSGQSACAQAGAQQMCGVQQAAAAAGLVAGVAPAGTGSSAAAAGAASSERVLSLSSGPLLSD